MFWSYTYAITMLRGKPFRNLEKTKTLLAREKNGDIHLQYVSTNVVTYHADNTFTLNTDGYTTKTTIRRLNEFSPAEIYVKGGRMFIKSNSQEADTEFFDGIRVDAFGDPIDPEDYLELNPTDATLDNQIRKMYL